MAKKKEKMPMPINIGAVILEPGSSLRNKTGSWRALRPVVEKNKCISCGQCIKFCPEGCIRFDKNKKANVNYDYCKGDGICAQVCPAKAIHMATEEK